MGQLSIAGTIIAGPPTVASGIFPSAIYTTQLGLSQNPRVFSKATGVIQSRVETPTPGFEPLQGVGPTDRVRRGDVLYLRCDSALILRVSTFDPLGGPVIVELNPVLGLYVREFPLGQQLALLEAQGSATIEYAITGQ